MEMVPPYDLHSFVTMATYWVADFCILKALLHCTNYCHLTFIVQLSELKPHLNDNYDKHDIMLGRPLGLV